MDRFGHRRGLAGERRFIAFQQMRLNESGVGRHPAACFKNHYVSRNHQTREDFPPSPIPEHGGAGREHRLQGIERPFRPIFLDKTENTAE